MTVLRISSAAAGAFVASLLFPTLSANSQPNRQQRLEQLDHTVARAFQGVKKCVARELEHGSYPSNVDDALRVILARNCRRQYDAFSRRVWLLARRRKSAWASSNLGPPLSSRSDSTDEPRPRHIADPQGRSASEFRRRYCRADEVIE
jgi:hypothetical protein